MKTTKPVIILFWLITLCVSLACAQTLNSRKALGRYQQVVWQDQHGLPQNGVNAIVHTRDGYLWVGTFEGAARFDGVQFTVFDNGNTPALRTNHQILAMLEDRSGNLWMGTNGGGLVRYHDDQFQVYDTTHGLPNNQVRSILEDQAGNLWIATDGGLSCWREGRFTNYYRQDGLPDDQIWALAEDTAGAVWVGTENGLARIADKKLTIYSAPPHAPWGNIHALLVDRTGMLWVGSYGKGIYQYREGAFQPCFPALASALIRVLYEDRAGNVWAGTRGQGLALLEGNRCTLYSKADGLPSDAIVSAHADTEGDLWFGSEDEGLVRLRLGRFQVYTTQDGLSHDGVTATFVDHTGRVWLGGNGGLSVWQQGVIKAFTSREGFPGGSVGSLTEDTTGTIWLRTNGKAYQYRADRFLPAPLYQGQTIESARVVLGDRAGNVWIGTHGGGLYRYHDGQYSLYTIHDGLASNQIWNLHEDRAGGIWMGGFHGLSYWRAGKIRAWSVKDGLSSDQPLSFYEDHQGGMWIGTSGGGLSYYRDGKFTNVTVKDGLYDNLAFQMLCDTEDDSGDLWISSNRGIFRVSLPELNDFVAGRRRKVTSYVYGVNDGMLTRECNGANPAGAKTPDGKLWFPTTRGAVVIDPHLRALQPPRVAIESAIVGGQSISTREAIQLAPAQENLEIRYTALSWGRPDQVRFKYRMIGLDQDWNEVGTRRTAYFSHLPPGSYEFRVIADNGEGLWDYEGQRLRIIVHPPFYRTWWFVTLAALSVAGAVFAAFKYRVTQLERRQAAQQAFARQLIASQETERNRIAAELHDSLGQHLVVINNLALLWLHQHADNNDQPIKVISATTLQAINEVKEISHNLRPYQLSRIGLTKVIEALLKKAEAASGIRFISTLDNLRNVLPPEAEINFYRIVQECVNNILKHSQATEATVTIHHEVQRLRLTIRDNGKGFTPEVCSNEVHGFGLLGIRERAQLLGGQASIQSAPGQGATITLEIALQQNP